MEKDKKKYNYMENVLQVVNKMYISLPQKETQRAKGVLKQVTDQVIGRMKKDPLFKALYTRTFYGGSFYDGVRVGHPEEFDLDILLKLPEFSEPELTDSDKLENVYLRLNAMERFKRIPESQSYPGFAQFVDSRGYLLNSKVRAWIESVLDKAMNDFKIRLGDYAIINTSVGRVKAKVHKTGPAFTMKLKLESNININRTDINLDIDLVPCFILPKKYWPPPPYRQNPVLNKPDFFIAPGPSTDDNNAEIYWRLSFQEQERVLIHNRRALKPVLKLIKRLRDQEGHDVVKSYYIKTIFMRALEELNKDFWHASLSYVFVTMLEKYQQYIESGVSPYYWHPNNKLLHGDYPSISNQLKAIIQDIKHPKDLFVAVKYFVPSDQVEYVKSQLHFGKKSLQRFQKLQSESCVQG